MNPNNNQEENVLRRNRTLFRAERNVQEAPLLTGKSNDVGPWVIFSRIVTFMFPAFILNKAFGLATSEMRQAWREKVALVFIIACICGILIFLTIFLTTVFCPGSISNVQNNLVMIGKEEGSVGILGRGYSTKEANFPGSFEPKSGQDITYYFDRPLPDSCKLPEIQKFRAIGYNPCNADNGVNGCLLGVLPEAITARNLTPLDDRTIGFDWSDVKPGSFVINGIVVDITTYLKSTKSPIAGDKLDEILFLRENIEGQDNTMLFQTDRDLKLAAQCLLDKYRAGYIAKSTIGCFGVMLYNYIALIIILLIVLIRFTMALVFKYFISWKLVKRPSRDKLRPMSYNTAAPWNSTSNDLAKATKTTSASSDELYTVLLVTCYSEGLESIKGTCDSLAKTEYNNNRKLLFLVADGVITGSGNSESTPDICIGLIEQEEPFLNPEPCSYIAVAAGSKKYNEAKVYCGYYNCEGQKVPTLVVVKSGGPLEQSANKPGNRGKRDSQIILMGFFSRVLYNDRLCPLDYDLFRKVQHLTGATPDLFEIVLMVDADTKVYPDSVRLLVNCLNNDQLIMGICGETRIANKRQSWVTAIQVYEYYISHHLGKAFESVFGGVTCLPGCFCMYRLKARKGNDWVPVLTKPEILQDYSQSIVKTLHEKNLLLLGEDRFLTTLMLRNFPNRKMMFMPQAVCKTIVPDEFKVLLSQRRRWINSTIHNLMELVLVRNLCGTFCLSMQFSIFLDLIGTVTLPVAIFLTFLLIIQISRSSFTTISSYIPLIMLLVVLFVPALIVVFTSRKYIYLMWMIIYLFALPVWNFILPVYAYWHFDDFSWGETRKVSGEGKDSGHGDEDGEFNSKSVPLKRWEDYERKRLRNIRYNKNDSQYEPQDDYYNNSTFIDNESAHLMNASSLSMNNSNKDQYVAQDHGSISPQQRYEYNNRLYSQDTQNANSEFELQTFNSQNPQTSYNSHMKSSMPIANDPNDFTNYYTDQGNVDQNRKNEEQTRKKPTGARALKRN
ncbi:hypothetical protein BB561_004732 [Smittium simulii]|uniref:chitin synthase n=1 Tax=Smittium simulii TaxID=133385 RepID=A0A2T9YEH1_9FUNG|nr:hypothetical protein BB561_004732 [Smittium simulii]